MALRKLLALGAVVGGGVWFAQRRREVGRAAPELQHRGLYLAPFFRIGNDRKLRVIRRLREAPPEPLPGATVSRERAGGTEVLVVDRPERSRPSGAILWIHGGGRIVGTPERDVQAASSIAEELGVPVICARYRLAPEHPYPAGLDDCMDALRWVHANAERLGVDPARIAIAGASAGGGLAAEVAQRALDEGGPAIAFQALMFPMLDDRTVLRGNPDGRGRLAWGETSNCYAWRSYLGHCVREDVPDPYVAAARREDLSGLPPAWIGVGDLDLLYDEDLDYARRLNEAGVKCELLAVPRMYHAANAAHPDAPSMVEFHSSFIEALRRAIC